MQYITLLRTFSLFCNITSQNTQPNKRRHRATDMFSVSGHQKENIGEEVSIILEAERVLFNLNGHDFPIQIYRILFRSNLR